MIPIKDDSSKMLFRIGQPDWKHCYLVELVNEIVIW